MAEATIQDVTCQALSAITNLKTLSANLLEARTKLQRKSYQTKEEIYSAVSRQLEALRDREIWLLTQVDTITQLKEEDIQEQLTAATEGLVLLQEKLAALQKNPDQSLCDLSETIQRLRDMDHVPLEDPDLHFEAKGDKLRRKIHSFGSVSSNKRPRLDKYSAANQPTPANLPFMMKSLGLTDPDELFAVFNESRPTSYWLQEQDKARTSWHTSGTIATPYDTSLVISQWLVEEDIQQDGPPEDDSTVEMTNAVISSGVQERMEAILSSPLELWLCRDEEEQMSSGTQEQHTSDIPEDCQEWLMVETVGKDEPSQCVCIASGERPMDMDIENLASLLCVQHHQPQPRDEDLSSWLVRDESQNEERPPIASVCRANELCGSFSECLCEDNCAGFPRSDDKNSPWLARSDNMSGDVLRQFDEQFVVSDWLAPEDDKDSSESNYFSKYENSMKSECQEQGKWLCNESSQKEESLVCLEIDAVSTNLLNQSEDDGREKDDSVVEVVEKFHGAMTKTSDWLNNSEEDDEEAWLIKKDEVVDGGNDSNKWLVEDKGAEKSVGGSSLPFLEKLQTRFGFVCFH